MKDSHERRTTFEALKVTHYESILGKYLSAFRSILPHKLSVDFSIYPTRSSKHGETHTKLYIRRRSYLYTLRKEEMRLDRGSRSSHGTPQIINERVEKERGNARSNTDHMCIVSTDKHIQYTHQHELLALFSLEQGESKQKYCFLLAAGIIIVHATSLTS